MRKIRIKTITTLSVFILSTLISSAAQALCFNHFSDRGLYIIGQIGSGSTDVGFLDDLFSQTEFTHNQGVAARGGVGYQVFRYVGFEGGFTVYPTATRDYNSSRGWFGSGNHSFKSKISNIYSVDVMAMARLPILNYVFVSAGGGFAIMHFKYEAMECLNNNEEKISWESSSSYFSSPKIALRVGVKFNRKIALFLSASHIFSTNGDNNLNARDYQPGLSLAAVGLTYHL